MESHRYFLRGLTATDVMSMVRMCKFRDFSKADWQAFSGCESEFPMIAYVSKALITRRMGIGMLPSPQCVPGEALTIILDGDRVEVLDVDGNSRQFLLGVVT
jgi:hypothetical protein